MANDFANTITLQNGDIYDIHDTRIRETSTADAGKALKVNAQGELEFADAAGNDCAKIYYTNIAPTYFTANEINEIVNGNYSIVSNSGINYFVAWLDNEELGLIHYDVETDQCYKIWYEGGDDQWTKTSEGNYSFATQEYVQNAVAGVQTGTKLYGHNVRIGSESIIITLPVQTLTPLNFNQVKLCAIGYANNAKCVARLDYDYIAGSGDTYMIIDYKNDILASANTFFDSSAPL